MPLPRQGQHRGKRVGRADAFDEDGDGEADGSTYIVGPNGEIPLNAQLNGSPDHGIVNICGPEGCS